MTHARIMIALALLLGLSLPAAGSEMIGGDIYEAGAGASLSANSPRDAFVTGFSVALDGAVGSDGHAAGFDVDVGADVTGDLYAAGGSVSVTGPVGEDLSAVGFSVRTGPNASVHGNARLAGGALRINGPVTGSLAATGGNIELNAAIGGDVFLTGAEISFGNGAHIAGNLTYSAPSAIDIPASVIEPDRVRFVQLEDADRFDQWRDMAEDHMWAFWPSLLGMLAGFVVTIVFLLVIAAICLAFMPVVVEKGRVQAAAYPGRAMLAGFLTLATLIGLVPVSAITIIGLPLIPVVILFIIAAWVLAYLLGAYTIALGLFAALSKPADTTPLKLGVLAAGLVVLAILNFIPVLGWLINFGVVLFGLGAMAILTGQRLFSQVPASAAPSAAV